MTPISTAPIEPIGSRMQFGRQRPFWDLTPEAKMLAMLRQHFGLTAFGAAVALGVDVSVLNEIEAGARTCDWDAVYARLSEAGEAPT